MRLEIWSVIGILVAVSRGGGVQTDANAQEDK
jgi:hypothetical protein